jgi:HD-like signal output (HDOD) protein
MNSLVENLGNLQDRRGCVPARFSEDLPILPERIFALNEILSASPVDLNRLAELSGWEPRLVQKVLRCCNSNLFDLPQPISTLQQAVIFVGADAVRTLVLICRLVEYVEGQIAAAEARAFWPHSFLAALLSERIARWINYPFPEQAYLAGMLHDIGALPILAAASRRTKPWDSVTLEKIGESLEDQRQRFGVDHCELGHWIGVCWNFPGALVEVFESHHGPTSDDAPLVGIVCAAEQFCYSQGLGLGSVMPRLDSTAQGKDEKLLEDCLPGLDVSSRIRLAQALESDFINMLQRLKRGLPKPLPAESVRDDGERA